MAKNNSYLKFEGTLGGLTYYEKDGKSLVKVKSSVSKSRIEKDPNYKRTRENMQEFGGAAKASKALRDSLITVVKSMGDTYLSARLTGIMRKMLNTGTGIRGKREINILANKDLLEGFELNKKDALSTQFYAPYKLPSLNANRDIATWTIPDFNTDAFITAPEGATHFKLILAAGLVSDYEFVQALNSYEPVDESENAIGNTSESAAIPIVGDVGSDITLTVDLEIGTPVVATTATLTAIGIMFFQDINGQFYQLASSNAMKIATVG